MVIKPIKDRVLVRCDKPATQQTSGGIYLAQDIGYVEQDIGVVVAVGPGKYHEDGPHKGKFVETYVKPGDRILFSIEGSEPLGMLDTDEHHYEILKSESYILGTL